MQVFTELRRWSTIFHYLTCNRGNTLNNTLNTLISNLIVAYFPQGGNVFEEKLATKGESNFRSHSVRTLRIYQVQDLLSGLVVLSENQFVKIIFICSDA